MAAGVLWSLAAVADNAVTIAAADAIPPLVQLLGPDSSEMLQESAAGALWALAANADNAAIIAGAGAFAALMQLARPGSPARVQETASRALTALTALVESNPELRPATIAVLEAIDKVMQTMEALSTE
jgi:hypothetical protein